MFLVCRRSRTVFADDSERHGHVLGLPLEHNCFCGRHRVDVMFLINRRAGTDQLPDDNERHGHCSWLTVGADQLGKDDQQHCHISWLSAKEDELTDDNKRDGHVLG
jgi:hypothetical protein